MLCAVGMEFRAVFVSTVRSRHRVRQLTGSVGEFGFLSEAQLVNTALTRAKSWLAVVGDPVALCSIGNCGTVWRSYLKHCQKVGGLHPADLSLEDIWQQSQSLMQLLTVNSLHADTAELRQSQAPAYVSPYITAETSSETVSETVSVTKSQQSSQTSSGVSEWQSAVSVLQQIHGNGLDEAGNTAAVRTTKRTAIQVVNIEEAKAYGRHEMSESSSSEVENSDGEDMRLREKTLAHRRTNSDANDAAAAAADDDGDDDDDDVVSFAEWSLDYQLEADEIIRQIAQVCSCSVSVLVCRLVFTSICVVISCKTVKNN